MLIDQVKRVQTYDTIWLLRADVPLSTYTLTHARIQMTWRFSTEPYFSLSTPSGKFSTDFSTTVFINHFFSIVILFY